MGLRRIMLPKANEKDLKDVPEAVRSEMEVILVESIEEALKQVLTKTPNSPPMEKGNLSAQPPPTRQSQVPLN